MRAVGSIVGADDIEDIVQEAFIKSYEAELKQEIPSAICIPAGEEHNISQVDHILDKVEKFLDIVIEKQEKANGKEQEWI